MKLIIVESPTKSRTLQAFLGKEYKIEASMGHVRDLPASTLGVDVEKDFTPTYVIPPKARKTITLLKKESKKAEETILATDEDREGESIAWHLAQVLELQNPKRIVFHEITKGAIEEALENPRAVDEKLVDAQQTRRMLDRLVGYKLSPFLWKKVARNLSAGRVQSVAVRLVAEREKEIKAFVPQEYWTIEASLATKENKEFKAQLFQKKGKLIEKLALKSKKEGDKILKDLGGADWNVSKVEKKETKRNPLPPFTTSTLQQEAWKRFHLPAKFTMSLAQHLYEIGLITYHRTDSLNLSQFSLQAAKEHILNTYGKNYWAGFSRTFKTKAKGAQEAHEAIRPTFVQPRESLNAQGQKLYELIFKRFIASQMAEAVFDSTSIEITTDKQYDFRATGQTLRFEGFLTVYPIKFEETELPPIKEGEPLKLLSLIPSQHFTEPAPRYTEATLVKALEEHGIGRPSTYAPILSTIQDRRYVEKDEKKRFIPTQLGVTVNDLLVANFPEIVDIQFTAEMEEKLDEIAEGKMEWVPMLKEFYGPFEKNLEKKYEEVEKKKSVVEPTNKTCPDCSSPLVIREGRFGKFYACSMFPKCRYTERLAQPTVSLGVCEKCKEGQVVQKRTRKGRMFYGCNRYPACDFATWQKPQNEVELK